MQIENILAVRNDRFGEFLLNIPAFRALKEKYPQASLTLVVNPSVKELAESVKYANDLVIWENKKHTLKEVLRFSGELKREGYDLCVIFNPTKEFHLIAFLAGIPLRVGYARKWGFLLTHKIEDKKHLGDKHEVEYNLDLAALVGAQASDQSISFGELQLIPELSYEAAIVIHPYTSDPVKQWPIINFVGLAKRIRQETKNKIVIIGKADSRGIGFGEGVINLTNKTSLKELALILKQSRLLISGDSGPMHLAAALGTPVIALFRNDLPGKTAKRWGPWGEGHIVIERNSLSDITVDEVLDKVKEVIER